MWIFSTKERGNSKFWLKWLESRKSHKPSIKQRVQFPSQSHWCMVLNFRVIVIGIVWPCFRGMATIKFIGEWRWLIHERSARSAVQRTVNLGFRADASGTCAVWHRDYFYGLSTSVQIIPTSRGISIFGCESPESITAGPDGVSHARQLVFHKLVPGPKKK